MAKRSRDEAVSRPTVFDVAGAAGVSTATVSRVLNGSADVSQALKDKVTQTIDNLGYVRDSTARALATKRTFRMGLILPSAASQEQSEVLQAFEATLADQSISGGRYCTLVARSNWQVEDLRRCLTHLREHGAEGAFALGELPLQALGAIAHSGDFALVSLSGQPQTLQQSHLANSPDSGADQTGSPEVEDVAGAGQFSAPDPSKPPDMTNPPAPIVGSLCLQIEREARKLTTYLMTLGHENVVIAHPRNPGGSISDGFVRGVLAEFAQNYASPPTLLSTSASYAGGAQALSAALELPTPPTVMLASQSDIALGALFEAQRQGLAVPDDLSIGGIISPLVSQAAFPALSGIEIDGTDIGRNAALSLIDRVEGRIVPTGLSLPLGLTIRDSFAPPAAPKTAKSGDSN